MASAPCGKIQRAAMCYRHVAPWCGCQHGQVLDVWVAAHYLLTYYSNEVLVLGEWPTAAQLMGAAAIVALRRRMKRGISNLHLPSHPSFKSKAKVQEGQAAENYGMVIALYDDASHATPMSVMQRTNYLENYLLYCGLEALANVQLADELLLIVLLLLASSLWWNAVAVRSATRLTT